MAVLLLLLPSSYYFFLLLLPPHLRPLESQPKLLASQAHCGGVHYGHQLHRVLGEQLVEQLLVPGDDGVTKNQKGRNLDKQSGQEYGQVDGTYLSSRSTRYMYWLRGSSNLLRFLMQFSACEGCMSRSRNKTRDIPPVRPTS